MKRRINEHAVYHVGTGCVAIDGAVVELTVREEELFELLLRTPKVTVPWGVIAEETCMAQVTIRTHLRAIRTKLGTRVIRTHYNKGVSLQPQFVGTALVRLQAVRRAG